MAYQISQKAEDDLINIYVEGFRLFGRVQAEKYHVRLEKTFEALAINPGMGTERLEISPPVRIFPTSAHIVIYTIEATGDILIARVRHGREDWVGDGE